MPRWMPVAVLLALALAAWTWIDGRAHDPAALADRAQRDDTSAKQALDASPGAGGSGHSGPRLAAHAVPGVGGAVGGASSGPRVLRGHVEDMRGARLPRVDIAATSDDAPGEPAIHTTSRGDGTFALSVARAGLYLLEARLGAGAAAQEASGWFAAGEVEHTLVLSTAPVRLSVDVVDEVGRPVPRFRLRVGPNFAPVEGRAGRGTVALSFPGTEAPRHAPDRKALVWGAQDDAGRALDLGAAWLDASSLGAEPVRVVLPRLKALSGRVLDGAGQGVPGIAVTLAGDGWAVEADARDPAWPASKRSLWDGLVASTTTDADGAFRIAHVHAQARLRLAILAPAIYVQPSEVRLGLGEAPEPLHLRLAVSPRVRIEGPRGPVHYATVVVRPTTAVPGGASQEVTGQSDSLGFVTLARLDPEVRYHLSAEPALGSRTWLIGDREMTSMRLAPLWVDSWVPREETFRLAWAQPLCGRVLDTSGLPAADVGIKAVHAGSAAHYSGTTDAQGAFAWEAPPAGPLLLEARWNADVHPRLRLEVEVEESERDGLVVRLPTGPVCTLELELDATMSADLVDRRKRPSVLVWTEQGWRTHRACRTDWMPQAAGEERLLRVRVLGLVADERARIALLLPQVGFVDTELASPGLTRRRLHPGATLRLRLPAEVPPDQGWWVALRGETPGPRADAVRVQAQGRSLEVRGIPAGSWRVRLTATERPWASRTVRASTDGVTDVPPETDVGFDPDFDGDVPHER